MKKYILIIAVIFIYSKMYSQFDAYFINKSFVSEFLGIIPLKTIVDNSVSEIKVYRNDSNTSHKVWQVNMFNSLGLVVIKKYSKKSQQCTIMPYDDKIVKIDTIIFDKELNITTEKKYSCNFTDSTIKYDTICNYYFYKKNENKILLSKITSYIIKQKPIINDSIVFFYKHHNIISYLRFSHNLDFGDNMHYDVWKYFYDVNNNCVRVESENSNKRILYNYDKQGILVGLSEQGKSIKFNKLGLVVYEFYTIMNVVDADNKKHVARSLEYIHIYNNKGLVVETIINEKNKPTINYTYQYSFD